MCLDLKRSFAVIGALELIIIGGLLGFSIFLLLQDVSLSNFWPIVGISLSGWVRRILKIAQKRQFLTLKKTCSKSNLRRPFRRLRQSTFSYVLKRFYVKFQDISHDILNKIRINFILSKISFFIYSINFHIVKSEWN